MAKKNKKNYRGKAAIPDPTTVSKALPTPIYSTLVLTPPRREINDIGNWKSALRAADIASVSHCMTCTPVLCLTVP